MGSRIMEPYDAADYAETILSRGFDNITQVCVSMNRIHARGSALVSNPLTFSLPLLLAQFSLASTSTLFSALLLKPLSQPFFAAQMLGGIIIGPSFLGQFNVYLDALFPLWSFVMLDLLSSMAFMMYIFLVGVELDTTILMKINKRAVVTGIVSAVVPLGLTEAFSLALVKSIYIDSELIRKIPIVAQVQSALAVPTIAHLLEELNMTNSELGRTAMRSSLVSGIFGFAATFSIVLAGESLQDKTIMITTVAAGLIFTAAIVFAVRPAIMYMMRRCPMGGAMTRDHFIALALLVLLAGFCSHVVGLHLYYGPFVLGLIMPVEFTVGSVLKEKLGSAVKWMLLPFFFLKIGLVVDIFSVELKNYAILQSIAVVAALGKFGGSFAAFMYYKTPIVDAAVLGLLMVVQGLFELGIFKTMKKTYVIDNDAFVIMCISMLLITGLVVPAIKWLYDPSRRYMVYKRRTVTSSRPDSELRLLICLHGEDQVPTAINFLETLNPTSESPLSVFVLHLVEQLGPEKPHLVPYKAVEQLSFQAGPSEAIVKAFKSHEQSNPGLVSVSVVTGTTQAAKMHDYACSLAIDERISIIVVPYSRKFHPRKTRHKAATVMNKNLIERSPCSVGILVDRGLLKSSRPAPNVGAWSPFRVGVVFLGGEDDREALAIGERMTEHPSIRLTMTRLLVSGNVAGNDTRARRLDNEALSAFRQSMAGNSHVTYIEEVVTDWSGTVAVIRSMESKYELVLVGRAHDRQSPLLSGLVELRENAELGAIGQILISPDFRDKATVLVVQQQNSPPMEGNASPKQSLGSKISKMYDQSEASFQSKSPIRGDDKSKSLEDDDTDDSSSDITCIIKGDTSRSHLTCPMATESSEESVKNFSNMRWVYEPVTPQSNWQSDCEAAAKRPASSTDHLDFQGNCNKASRLY